MIYDSFSLTKLFIFHGAFSLIAIFSYFNYLHPLSFNTNLSSSKVTSKLIHRYIYNNMGIIAHSLYKLFKHICPDCKVLICLFFPVFLYSQKDLKLTLLSPDTNKVIIRYHPFIYKVKISNVGNINVLPNDLMEVNIQLFGNNVYTAIVPHSTILPGDSLIFSDIISFNFSAEYHGEQFCSGVGIQNNIDPTPLDQFDCHQIDLLLYPTAVVNVNEGLNNLSIFPNPSNGKFAVLGAYPENDYPDLNIFDSVGRCIYTQKAISAYQDIDISSMPKGLYFISISDHNNLITKKIIVE